MPPFQIFDLSGGNPKQSEASQAWLAEQSEGKINSSLLSSTVA